MNTRINTAHGSEVVTDHREQIPLNSDGTVDYQAMGKRLELAYGCKNEHWTKKFN